MFKLNHLYIKKKKKNLLTTDLGTWKFFGYLPTDNIKYTAKINNITFERIALRSIKILTFVTFYCSAATYSSHRGYR